MRHTLSRRLLGILAACVLLPLATAHSQAPQPPAARDTIQKLEAELEARRAKLQELVAQQARLAAEIEVQKAETRLTEQKLQEAKARTAGDAGRAPRGPASTEERLERLEQQLLALQRELRAFRAGPGREDKAEAAKFAPVDLQPYANQKVKESMGSGSRPANTLASLPAGQQKFLDIPFQVGEGLMQLGSTELADKPEKIKDIEVGRKLAKLHFLHATVFYLGRRRPSAATPSTTPTAPPKPSRSSTPRT
jgi:hypothetical protein